MNIKHKLMIAGLSILSAMPFASCSNEDTYDVVGNPDNLVYFASGKVSRYDVVHTPIGDFSTVAFKQSLKILRPTSMTTKVNVVADSSLVSTYNSHHGTAYLGLDPEYIQWIKANVTFDKGDYESKDSIALALKAEALPHLTGSTYLLPIRISSVDGNGTPSQERGIAYIIIDVSTKMFKDISSKDDVAGTLITEYNNWTVKYNTGTQSDAVQLFDGDLTNGTPLRTDGADGTSTTLLVDMGKTIPVSGFRFARYYKSWYGGWWYEQYYFSSIKIELSTDGTAWTEAGTITTQEMPQSDGYQYASFYGGVQARYLRLSFDSGSSTVSSLAELGIYQLQ